MTLGAMVVYRQEKFVEYIPSSYSDCTHLQENSFIFIQYNRKAISVPIYQVQVQYIRS